MSPRNEVNISTTRRPYFTTVQQVCSEDGHLRFGIDANKVDSCVASIMGAIQDYHADEVVAAVGIAFILVMRRFEFHLPSYLGFVENFLNCSDIKLGCHALQRLLGSLFKNHLTRYDQVCLNKEVVINF